MCNSGRLEGTACRSWREISCYRFLCNMVSIWKYWLYTSCWIIRYIEKSELNVSLSSFYFVNLRCGPCKVIAPQIEAMSKEMADVVFLKVDVDENEDAAQEYNISAMPTFIFIKNQAKVRSLYYMRSKRLIIGFGNHLSRHWID